MIFISIFDLIPTSFKYLFKFYELIPSIIIISIFLFFGFLFIYFIKHVIKVEEDLYKVGIISMIALIVHNIPEGIITFLTTTKDFKLGLSLSLSIALHNIPEGISIFVPIYFSNHNKKKAILYTFNDIDVTKDGLSVKASISISITNKDNETIANISTMEEDVFTITYLVNYESFATTIKRTIKIVK